MAVQDDGYRKRFHLQLGVRTCLRANPRLKVRTSFVSSFALRCALGNESESQGVITLGRPSKDPFETLPPSVSWVGRSRLNTNGLYRKTRFTDDAVHEE